MGFSELLWPLKSGSSKYLITQLCSLRTRSYINFSLKSPNQVEIFVNITMLLRIRRYKNYHHELKNLTSDPVLQIPEKCENINSKYMDSYTDIHSQNNYKVAYVYTTACTWFLIQMCKLIQSITQTVGGLINCRQCMSQKLPYI